MKNENIQGTLYVKGFSCARNVALSTVQLFPTAYPKKQWDNN